MTVHAYSSFGHTMCKSLTDLCTGKFVCERHLTNTDRQQIAILNRDYPLQADPSYFDDDSFDDDDSSFDPEYAYIDEDGNIFDEHGNLINEYGEITCLADDSSDADASPYDVDDEFFDENGVLIYKDGKHIRPYRDDDYGFTCFDFNLDRDFCMETLKSTNHENKKINHLLLSIQDYVLFINRDDSYASFRLQNLQPVIDALNHKDLIDDLDACQILCWFLDELFIHDYDIETLNSKFFEISQSFTEDLGQLQDVLVRLIERGFECIHLSRF